LEKCCRNSKPLGRGFGRILAEVDGMKEVPEALNKIVDIVLAYRPKPKTKAALKRKKLKAEKDREAKSGG
jgi:hypothetical protein